MHAFDLAKLAGPEIRVRRAKPGETITTLDGVERKLEPDMLVIADRDRAQAIAGVMGGAASEVSAATTTVAFESAYFKPASVRRTSKRLGLKTEASSRFERGADIGAQVVALAARAGADGAESAPAGAVGPIVDCYPAPARPRRLHLRRDAARALLGVVGARCGRRADPAQARARRHADRRRLGRRGADVPRRPAARGRSHRGGRPPLRLRQAGGDLPRR